jgi:parallel beta-helix repeat protein
MNIARPCLLLTLIVLASGGRPPVTACGDELSPPLVITEPTKLDPKKTYSRIIVKAPDITIDGQGAWLIGATEGKPKDFKGTAIEADGVDGVTLKNVNAKGFETGLRVSNAARWTIENCNFSDNFHDPDFGWGENGRRGGIVLNKVSRSTLRKNKANRVWDACVLMESDRNVLEENDFSKTSNTCLKLWTFQASI